MRHSNVEDALPGGCLKQSDSGSSAHGDDELHTSSPREDSEELCIYLPDLTAGQDGHSSVSRSSDRYPPSQSIPLKDASTEPKEDQQFSALPKSSSPLEVCPDPVAVPTCAL